MKWYAKELSQPKGFNQGLVIDEETGDNVAVIYRFNKHGNLIAHAPELAETLKSLVHALSTDIEDYPDSSYYTLIMDRRNRAQALLYELESQE